MVLSVWQESSIGAGSGPGHGRLQPAGKVTASSRQRPVPHPAEASGHREGEARPTSLTQPIETPKGERLPEELPNHEWSRDGRLKDGPITVGRKGGASSSAGQSPLGSPEPRGGVVCRAVRGVTGLVS